MSAPTRRDTLRLGAGALLAAALPARAISDPLAGTRLTGRAGWALVDLVTGAPVDLHAAEEGFPLASAIKAVTALFALETLGRDHRFETRLLATGPTEGGVVQGDLALQGGGDPELDSDALADMLARARTAGLAGATGRVLGDAGALGVIPAIEPTQPAHVPYNPSVAGLNLNFNRVRFAWSPRPGAAPKLEMTATGARVAPATGVVRIAARPGVRELFRHRLTEQGEAWEVDEGALREGGRRWLPVRRPALYAADALRGVADLQGLPLGPAATGAAPAGARQLARHAGRPLHAVLAGMMRHSTNLTAEAAGLSAAHALGARPASLAESGATMARWMAGRAGLRAAPVIANHSGLTTETRVSPADMAAFLRAATLGSPARARAPGSLVPQASSDAAAPDGGGLIRLMKDVALTPQQGEPEIPSAAAAVGKTGTLYYVSALAGYMTTGSGRACAYVICLADLPARAGMADLSRDAGGRRWTRRAKAFERDLLRDWARRH